MEELLARVTGRREGAPADFRSLLDAGFREVDGCVFLRELFKADDASALPSFRDATGFEASINKVHLESFLDRDVAHDPPSLAEIAHASSRELSARLQLFSQTPFRVIATVQGKHCTIRFHKLRTGESWLVDDLEAYTEAVLVMDTM